jgi:hypothetical protein
MNTLNIGYSVMGMGYSSLNLASMYGWKTMTYVAKICLWLIKIELDTIRYLYFIFDIYLNKNEDYLKVFEFSLNINEQMWRYLNKYV